MAFLIRAIVERHALLISWEDLKGAGKKTRTAQGRRYSASSAPLPEFMPVKIFRNPRVRFE